MEEKGATCLEEKGGVKRERWERNEVAGKSRPVWKSKHSPSFSMLSTRVRTREGGRKEKGLARSWGGHHVNFVPLRWS